MTTTITCDRDAFLGAIRACPLDQLARLVYADWCDEHGDPATAAALRDGTWQMTVEGEQIVTVGRDGVDTDRHCHAIHTTKVYEAVRRQRDGRLTWRLVASLPMHRTAGKGVSGPMIARAKQHADKVGLRYIPHITHGSVCL